MRNGAPRLIVPAKTRSPGPTRCGTVSPVIRLRVELAGAAARRAPSTPIRSPAATSTSCPASQLLAGARCGSCRRAASTVTAAAFSASSRSAAERGAAAGALVEIAADQQEEQERDRRCRNRRAGRRGWSRPGSSPGARITPSEIGTSMLVRPARSARAGRAEERPAGIGDGRQRDQRLEPVQQVARARRPCPRRGRPRPRPRAA